MKIKYYSFYLALFFIISCQKKEVVTNTTDFKKDKVVSISLLTDHFIYTPFYYKDHLQLMCNAEENEFVYNIKNETNKTLIVFLNYVNFNSLHPTLLTDKNAIDSEIETFGKRYLKPYTYFSYNEMDSMLSKKNIKAKKLPFNANINKILSVNKILQLKPFEETKIYVKTTLPKQSIPVSIKDIIKDKNEFLEFTALSYFVVFDSEEYYKLKEKKQPLLNYQIYQLNKALYYKY